MGSTNRYHNRNALWIDSQPGRSINHTHLARYIAASSIGHCSDGWGFVGRALECHARGDNNTALHLGYYAELRGALSLLATEGIGIFSNRHFTLNDSGNCQLLPNYSNGVPRTHDITWLALEHWAGLRRSANLLAEVVSPFGIELGDWFDAFLTGPALYQVGKDWFRTWGLDLRRLSEDREARNEVSYEPGNLNSRTSLDVHSSVSFLREVWDLLEPLDSSRFGILDRHLLRLSLEKAFEAVFGDPKKHSQDFQKRVERMLEVMATIRRERR